MATFHRQVSGRLKLAGGGPAAVGRQASLDELLADGHAQHAGGGTRPDATAADRDEWLPVAPAGPQSSSQARGAAKGRRFRPSF